MDREAYTITAEPLGVLTEAVDVPDVVSAAAANLFFGHPGDVFSQELGFNIEMYSVVGTAPLHVDAYFDEGADGFCALGLILVNESGVCLTDGRDRLPLPVGTVFRHDPCRVHGTCLPDGGSTDEGRFAFLSVDYELSSYPEDNPADFAIGALEDARDKLTSAGLLPPTEAPGHG